jgi:hypothetical protein
VPRVSARLSAQADVAIGQEVQNALQKTIEIVRATMQEEQKEISRCLAPEVRDSLREGYDRALEERGRGSVARQKVALRCFPRDPSLTRCVTEPVPGVR